MPRSRAPPRSRSARDRALRRSGSSARWPAACYGRGADTHGTRQDHSRARGRVRTAPEADPARRPRPEPETPYGALHRAGSGRSCHARNASARNRALHNGCASSAALAACSQARIAPVIAASKRCKRTKATASSQVLPPSASGPLPQGHGATVAPLTPSTRASWRWGRSSCSAARRVARGSTAAARGCRMA